MVFKVRKRVGKILSAVIAAMLSVTALSVCASAVDINTVRQGTVAVVFYLKNAAFYYYDPVTGNCVGSKNIGAECQMSSGSGFFVGNSNDAPQYIVTNHHVVDDYINSGEGGEFKGSLRATTDNYYYRIESDSCELRVYYDENNYDVAYIDCYGDTEKVDLAVLKLRSGTDKRKALKIGNVSDENVTDNVYVVGYPGNADNDFTTASKYGVSDSSVYNGTISKIVMDSKGVERIDITAKIQHGNSGGPLVNESGEVIGVNTNGWVTDETNYYSISSNTLKDFLDKNSIPYEKAGEGSSGSGSNDTPSVPAGTSTAPSSSDSGSSVVVVLLVISAVIVVIIGVVAAVVVLMKKKNGAAPAPVAPAMNAPLNPAGVMPAAGASVQRKAVIRSMAAQHNGMTFPVGKAPVTIGRKPGSCVIVYKDGTQGVSGVHCSVSYDSASNAFTLTDLGSSYGTFLLSGQKLAPNTPVILRPGDSFYVGDKTNICRLELV